MYNCTLVCMAYYLFYTSDVTVSGFFSTSHL